MLGGNLAATQHGGRAQSARAGEDQSRRGTQPGRGGRLYTPISTRPSLARAVRWKPACSPSQVAATLFSSAEHDTRVVEDLYQQFLHRPADPVGLNVMVTALLHGARQEQVAALLMGSDEYLLGRLQAGG